MIGWSSYLMSRIMVANIVNVHYYERYVNLAYSLGWQAGWPKSQIWRLCFLMAGRNYSCSTRSGFCAFAIADLIRSEPESADAAAPTRRRTYRDSRGRLAIGKP